MESKRTSSIDSSSSPSNSVTGRPGNTFSNASTAAGLSESGNSTCVDLSHIRTLTLWISLKGKGDEKQRVDAVCSHDLYSFPITFLVSASYKHRQDERGGKLHKSRGQEKLVKKKHHDDARNTLWP